MTDVIALDLEGISSSAARIGCNLSSISLHSCDRRSAPETEHIAIFLRRIKGARSCADVVYRSADAFRRNFDYKGIVRLEQNRLCVHKSVTDSTICGLTEVAAFCMLEMCSACRKSDFHIGNRRACQHAKMGLFAQMYENEPLPVAVQVVLVDV